MSSLSKPVHVLIAEDCPETQRALTDLLASSPDLQVVGIVEDGPAALEAAKRLSPDILLLDVSLPCLNGIEVARKLHYAVPRLRIIMLVEGEVEEVAKILEGKAQGYVLKSQAAATLGPALCSTLGQGR